MIVINEFLPDPQGADVTGEWVELLNNGDTPTSLVGFGLQNSAGKKYVFKNGEIGANAYLLLPRSKTKLTLKNKDETVSLFDAGGNLIDRVSFLGTAQSGKSYNRVEISGVVNFLPGDPTPGVPNKAAASSLIAYDSYTDGAILHASLGKMPIVALAFSVALVFAATLVFIFKTDAYLSELFFQGDETIRN